MVRNAVALGVCLLASSAAFGEEGYIEDIDFAGSGCAPGAEGGVKVTLKDTDGDKHANAFELEFSRYVARQGPGVPFSQRRRNCNLTLKVHVPKGQQFGVDNVTVSGSLSLPQGLVAKHTLTYEFPFASEPVQRESRWEGESSIDFRRTDTQGATGTLWSPCGQSVPLNIRSQVALEGDAGLTGQISISQLGNAKEKSQTLLWRACTP